MNRGNDQVYPSPNSFTIRYALPLILRLELGIQHPKNMSNIDARNDMEGTFLLLLLD